MSYWRTIMENEIFKIKNEIEYSKLNLVQQNIADLFQKNSLTKLEVELILQAMSDKVMLNADNAISIHREKYKSIYKHEGLL